MQLWPADKPQRWPIDKLVAYAKNAKQHPPEQVEQIANAIIEWGWTIPVLIDENGEIIAGHGRVLAAHKLKIAEVPVIVASGWTDAQKRAYRLADNKLTENGGWDRDLLGAELVDLVGVGIDLDLMGFTEDEFGSLSASATDGLTDPDDVPAAPVKPISAVGDLWILGKHRLLCGDSTIAADVSRVLAGAKPHLMVTDPPYGVEYEPGWRSRVLDPKTGKPKSIRATGRVVNDDRVDWRQAWDLFPGEVLYMWHSALHSRVAFETVEACGFDVRAQIIWAKSQIVIGRGNYHWQHEPCLYAVKGKGHWVGGRKQSTLWQIDKPQKSETGHGTQKPVECMKRPIENNSVPGQAVYEPFSGSGTTIIAAEMTGRSCHAIEIAPPYVDVAVRRWQDFTGQAAVLEGDGRTFEEVASERTRGQSRARKKAKANASQAGHGKPRQAAAKRRGGNAAVKKAGRQQRKASAAAGAFAA